MTPDPQQISVTRHAALSDIGEQVWSACASPEGTPARDPFTTYAFLSSLEDSGSVGEGTGWHPQHLVARRGTEVIGVMPLYLKGHSQGEYIFDHGWAEAYERAGGQYYPKLQVAAPFTPATGRRFLTRREGDPTATAALIEAATTLAQRNGLSSLHVTFCTEAEAQQGEKMGLMPRIGQQYHWENQGYESFDDFLCALSSRKRKAIRKERRTAQAFGGDIVCLRGDQITPAHWDAFWQFYQDTGARKWGRPYLTRVFFDLVHDRMGDQILLILATRGDQPVAGALNFIGRDRLYGRYWGAIEDHPCLHFELCYYQAIDWAIAHGLHGVEAGAQGDHKLARGYMPTPVHSLHWIADPGFARAVDDYLRAERSAMGDEISVLREIGPFRRGL